MKQSLYITIGIIFIAVVAFFLFRSPGTDELEGTDISVPAESEFVQNEFTELAPSEGLSETSELIVPESSPAQAGLVSVSIDDEGFDPATLTVVVGTTVVFTNNGQALHWPASDPHPTHGGLPGFDAKKGLATGETYSYTVAEAGTYGIHDHLNTTVKGSIAVE